MKKVDMIVKAPHFYTMEGDGVGYKADQAMIVDGGKIVDFIDLEKCDGCFKADEVLDVSSCGFARFYRRTYAYGL